MPLVTSSDGLMLSNGARSQLIDRFVEEYLQLMGSRVRRWNGVVVLLVTIALLAWSAVFQPVMSQDASDGRPSGNVQEQVETYENWNPVADYPIEQLEELLSTLVAQQDLNVTIANIAILYDLKLYVLADKLEEVLPAGERSVFQDEQRAWVDSRRESLEQNHTQINGTLAPFVTATSFVNLTKDRIALLEAQLQSFKAE